MLASSATTNRDRAPVWCRWDETVPSAGGGDAGRRGGDPIVGIRNPADSARPVPIAWLVQDQAEPMHAIPRADTDDNPATEPDPTWQQPLLNVNHPEYPSGHACLTGAASTALRLYFDRDRFRFTVDSVVTGGVREYGSFSATVAEASDARVWGGLHLRQSMHDGALVGRRAAWWVASRHFGI